MLEFRNWAGVCLAAGFFLAGCAKGEPIAIGAVGDMRSGGRHWESGFRNGISLAEETLNDRAGGVRVRVTYADDEGDPALVKRVDEKLIATGVVAIIGHNTSATTAAALPVVNRTKVPLFGTEATSSQFAGKDDFFVRNEVVERVMAEALATYAVDQMKLRSVGAVLDEKNQPFTRPFFESFQKKMKVLGGDAELLYPYHVLDLVEAGRQVEAFLKRGGDAVLLITNGADTRLLGPTFRRVQNELPLLGTTWAVPPVGSAQLGALPDNLIFPCTFDPDSKAPAYLEFKGRYEKRFGMAVDYHAVHAYEAMMILAQAAEKEGADRKRLVRAITRIGEFEGLQGPIRIDAYGDCEREIHMLREDAGTLRKVR
jgi:branched-chain amino acid transport system substrate-binding protein